MRRWRRLLAAAACACALGGATSSADSRQTVRLHAGFIPDILNSETNIQFGFDIASTVHGQLPSPLTHMVVHMPPGLVFITSTLGVGFNCAPSALALQGPQGCPAGAVIGLGGAEAKVMVGNEVMVEQAAITMLIGLPNPDHVEALLYANGDSPVVTELIFPAALYLETGPAGGRIEATIPPVEGLPQGPNVSLTRMAANFGPKGLTYYRHIHHRLPARRSDNPEALSPPWLPVLSRVRVRSRDQRGCCRLRPLSRVRAQTSASSPRCFVAEPTSVWALVWPARAGRWD
jgi:hypothetical protein